MRSEKKRERRKGGRTAIECGDDADDEGPPSPEEVGKESVVDGCCAADVFEDVESVSLDDICCGSRGQDGRDVRRTNKTHIGLQ